jgi:hypothetical protein
MSPIDIGPARWFAIKAMLRHLLFCWPRRWNYAYLERADTRSYRRTCLRCGITHEHNE